MAILRETRTFLKYVNPRSIENIGSNNFAGEGNLFQFKILLVLMSQLVRTKATYPSKVHY